MLEKHNQKQKSRFAVNIPELFRWSQVTSDTAPRW